MTPRAKGVVIGGTVLVGLLWYLKARGAKVRSGDWAIGEIGSPGTILCTGSGSAPSDGLCPGERESAALDIVTGIRDWFRLRPGSSMESAIDKAWRFIRGVAERVEDAVDTLDHVPLHAIGDRLADIIDGKESAATDSIGETVGY